MASVVLDRLVKRYGGGVAIDGVSLSLASGEFLTLLGPSGCGKSTTLRAVAGLVGIDSGRILLDGRNVNDVPIHRRGIGMVFQNLALFPHMSVAENVGFGPRMRGQGAAQRRGTVARALDLVRLGSFADRMPSQLSGGQQQRVAIARALVIEPKVLLLDEPFSALDRKLREEMQAELRDLTRRLGITAVFVTHDQEEALTLSDRIAVMNRGRVEQCGTPRAVFEEPETAFTADFMGCANLVQGVVEPGDGPGTCLRVGAARLHGRPPEGSAPAAGAPVTLTIRPERLTLRPAGGDGTPGVVRATVYQGAFTTYQVMLPAWDRDLTVRMPDHPDERGFAPGDAVAVWWREEDLRVLRQPENP